jgi:hypothetical protein
MESAEDFHEARRLYDTVVRRHSLLHRFLSKERCLALTQEGDRWWVWQMVRKVPTLATRLGEWSAEADSPERVAEALVGAAVTYLKAFETVEQAPEALPIAPDKIAEQDQRFVFAGLLPRHESKHAAPRPDSGAAFEDALRKSVSTAPGRPKDIPAVLTEMQRKATGRIPATLLEMMCSVLIGH